jgi:gamma-glutamylcyclotransferase (GGCT)/AIG2-like uncharacterized protein YtfP
MISAGVAQRDSLLFVYGTLRAFVDIPMARRLRLASRYVGRARVRGRLYDLGRYPGLVAARRRDEWVVGELYELAPGSDLLRALDRYEAGPAGRERPRFVRQRTHAVLDGHRKVAVWVYRYRRRVRPQTRIASGDYRLHVAGPDELAREERS